MNKQNIIEQLQEELDSYDEQLERVYSTMSLLGKELQKEFDKLPEEEKRDKLDDYYNLYSVQIGDVGYNFYPEGSMMLKRGYYPEVEGWLSSSQQCD